MPSLKSAILDLLIPAVRMHESYAAELTADLDDAQLDACPGPGHENTPRFTIGHLCISSALSVWVIENARYSPEDVVLDVPPVFERLFRRMGPGDRRGPEVAADAPSRDAILAEFKRQHDRVVSAIEAADDERLATPYPWKLGHHLPRVADTLTFMATHEALHLGQVACWRRAMGLPAAMSRMVENKT